MSEIINIKETVKLPSTALQYMVDGLLKQSKRKGFMINMETFGELEDIDTGKKSKQICIGCAATCAIQQLANKNLNKENIQYLARRAKYLGFDYVELDAFEMALDKFRYADFTYLFNFFGISGSRSMVWQYEKNYTYKLTTNSWKLILPEVKKLIEQLKSNGH